MVWIHQSCTARDDAVPVTIGIVAEGDIEAVFERDQLCHGIGRRTVHADLAVPIQRHELKRRVHRAVHHFHIDTVTFDDRLPVRHPRSAKRIDADLELGVSNNLHIDNRTQIAHVGSDIVVAVGCGRAPSFFEGNSRDVFEISRKQLVGPIFDPTSYVGICRSAMRRVVFEAAVFRRIV
jgi:hypothetical protein